MKASQNQVGGNHYQGLQIQPHVFAHANGIGFHEASAIKYLCRWKDKGGLQDLRKAVHFIELLIELEEAKVGQIAPDEAELSTKEQLDAVPHYECLPPCTCPQSPSVEPG